MCWICAACTIAAAPFVAWAALWVLMQPIAENIAILWVATYILSGRDRRG